MRPRPIAPGPGQESVWDYPRPPRLEAAQRRIRIVLGGVAIVETTTAMRVLETSHPPVYYVAPEDFTGVEILASQRSTFCEYKGRAAYATLRVGDRTEADAAWFYPSPSPGFEDIAGFLAVYPSRMDACFVDGEAVTAQPGDFYGGWITSDVVGPFKGDAGTWGW